MGIERTHLTIIDKNNRMRTTSNHFQPSDHLSNSDENQFLLAPSRLTYGSSKDQTIKKLEQKNQRLMTQIQKIEKVLIEPLQKVEYGNKLPQLNSKATQQQLQNAYKQIKSYEYEIKKLRGLAKDGSYVEQIKKNEALLKEKQEMSERLRKQLFEIKKQSMEITKFLTNDNKKEEYETKSTNLSSQIKWLREKLRQLQTRQNMNKDNREKQNIFIKKLQSSLMQQGFPIGTIRVLREKYAPAKQNPNESYYSSAKRTASKTTPNNRSSYVEQQQGGVEDRTPQAFSSLMSEVKLLQKMQKDYQSQAINLQKEKQDAANVNLTTRNKLVEVEEDIERIETRINELKKMIDPSKIKPTRGLSMPNASRYGDITKTLKSAFQHLYRNEQVGKLSKEGRRFGDRIKLGKNESKIVAVDFYELKQTGNVVGIQATYQIKTTLKKGPINMIVDQKLTTKKSLILYDNDDYFKSMECICNEKGGIIGVALMSNKGVVGRGGPMQGNRRPLNLGRNQYPACLYGSFSQNGIELLGAEVLEEKFD